ncbi:MAG: carbohydrate porin [Planctomycetota bacterium]
MRQIVFMVALASSVLAATRVVGQEDLSAGWFGNRDWLSEHGIDVDLSATQFYQGVASGGREQQWDYGGKLDYFVSVEGGKLGLSEGFFVDMHAETRFGKSVNDNDGLLAPANIAMSFPENDSSITSITGLKLTQALSETFALYAGKINTLDEYTIRFAGGPGIGGFMNTTLVFNPILARTVPYSAAAVGGAFLDAGEPLLSLTVFDPEERATKGLEDLYDRGVTIVPELNLRPEWFGLPGIYQIGGSYSNSDFTSIDPSAWLTIPIAAGAFPVENESWSLYFDFYQALWADASNPGRTWGVFGSLGLSDGNPNPIRYVVAGGIAGRSMLTGRTLDRFGCGYFYLGLSDEFIGLSLPIIPQRDEYGIELFYNYAFTSRCWLTADIQVVRPSTIAFDTVIIPGTRLQIQF